MSVTEMWYCDMHEPERDEDFVNADRARDEGWAEVERTVERPSALGGDKKWLSHERAHICATCLKDREAVAEWIAHGKYKPAWPEDAQRIGAAA